MVWLLGGIDFNDENQRNRADIIKAQSKEEIKKAIDNLPRLWIYRASTLHILKRLFTLMLRILKTVIGKKMYENLKRTRDKLYE